MKIKTNMTVALMLAALLNVPVSSAEMGRMKGRLFEQLDLTDQQTEQLQDWRRSQVEAEQAVWEVYRADMDADLEAVREEGRTTLESILTEEQLAQFDAMREKRQLHAQKRRGKDRPRGFHGGGDNFR